MTIQAEVSLYPLRTMKLGPVLDSFLGRLTTCGVSVRSEAMSSQLSGEASEVFAALFAAFSAAAQKDDVVLIIKASNACPMESTSS